jgi:hypothetical protein
MATKAPVPLKVRTSRRRVVSNVDRLHALIEKQRALTKELMDLMEDLEDAEDSRLLDEAIKRNAGKPGIPWAEAKKRLGLV